MDKQELEKSRAVMIRKYRAHPGLWPDGIDSKWDRWYTGKEHEWTEGRLARLLDRPVNTPETVNEGVNKAVNKAVNSVNAPSVNKADVNRKAERLAEARKLTEEVAVKRRAAAKEGMRKLREKKAAEKATLAKPVSS